MELQVKDILKEQGITQKILAEKVGMSVQQLNNTISGRNPGSVATYERIAEALGVDLWQLFAPKQHRTPNPPLRCPHCGHILHIDVK